MEAEEELATFPGTRLFLHLGVHDLCACIKHDLANNSIIGYVDVIKYVTIPTASNFDYSFT